MKLNALLVGVAALAIASAAQADTIKFGSRTNDAGVDYASIKATDYSAATNAGHSFSAFAVQGGSAGNNGTASTSDGATFTLKGAVSTDCAYYTGNASTTIDFGTIGIYASDNTGPANAFDMTAPANVSIDTNLAGCNTSNTVTVSKNDIRGLVNNSGAGYDSNVFQANLPYSVTGSYTAGAVGSAAPASQGNYISLATTANSTSASHGAWKSAMSLDVAIPVPSKSLLAGAYEGQLTVAIQAF
ncbi:hypothetical protein [Brevundimonas sp. PWP3-1b1]|uniref:hypothetical protein n=1 Tax=unclassified Brevundimonas TaxID=2622653 RepID=UPI003CEC6C7E